MKTKGIIMIALGLAFAGVRGVNHYLINMEYANKIGSNWDLAERASTISQKSEYIDKYVAALEAQELDGINANLVKQTPEYDFTENMKALKSLQERLKSISGMDENSFAYQTAIQQITQQEQGEAGAMLNVMYDCWKKKNYYTYYNSIIWGVFVLFQLALIIVGAFLVTH